MHHKQGGNVFWRELKQGFTVITKIYGFWQYVLYIFAELRNRVAGERIDSISSNWQHMSVYDFFLHISEESLKSLQRDKVLQEKRELGLYMRELSSSTQKSPVSDV